MFFFGFKGCSWWVFFRACLVDFAGFWWVIHVFLVCVFSRYRVVQ